MIITPEHIKNAITQEPELSYMGFYGPAYHKQSQWKNEDYVALLRSYQADLFTHVNEIQICYDWLQVQEIGAKTNARSLSSYGLKHAVEWASRQQPCGAYVYVSNGAFLAAVVIAKVDFKQDNFSLLNALVAVRHSRRNKKLWPPGKADTNYAEFKPFPVGYFADKVSA